MDLRSIAMGLAFAFMWSSAFASARIIVAAAPPVSALSLRFLISGLLALAIGAALGQSARLTRAQWRGVVIFGICQNALYLGVNFIAMRWVSASFAAIVASTMPLLVALAGWLIFHERLRPLTALGLVAGVAGVALIMGTRLSGGEDLVGFVLCAIGVVALAVATLTVRVASAGGNLLMIVGLQMLVGAAVLAPLALAFETPAAIDWSASLILAFAYTTLVPGLLATWIWFLLVSRIGAVRAAAFHFLNPFFGVAVAAALLGERMGIWDLVGVVVIAAGILAVQVSKMPAR
ncbi:EamA-like transporter family protein [Cereibacter ovatus]|uniref:EamA-like transporter family protein n=1 Tax=Cereibacter ovatus TaxID=439529 RepID=A0A285CQG3_9RHOB|nr:DMT family transporter [Cereibacter ovatus]SNX69744.1 EamA-like transporter family protein [Cereibacter ovatus]